MPTTATITEMPMATPSDVSRVRSRRARSPTVPSHRASANRSRARWRSAAGAASALASTPVASMVLMRTVRTDTGTYRVEAAARVDEVRRSVDAVRSTLSWALPALIVTVAAVAWLPVGRALRPVEAIRAEVEATGGTTMHRRVPEPRSPDEVGRLARTMNAMLGRLEASAQRQRQFVSDLDIRPDRGHPAAQLVGAGRRPRGVAGRDVTVRHLPSAARPPRLNVW